MSKKMLKRSFALGALMAFVITGSAMADSVSINESSDTGLRGIDYSNTSGLDLTGISSVTVSNTGTGGATGVNLENKSSATLGEITITSTSANANGFGFRLICGSEVKDGVTSISGNTVVVNGNANITANGGNYAQGIYSQYSDVTFEKNVTINATSTGDHAYAVRMLGDTDSETTKYTNSKIVFNGDLTEFNVKGNKYAWGIVASGANEGGGIYFNGGEVEVEVEANEQAVGIHTQYGTSALAASEQTSIAVTSTSTNGSAYGISAGKYAGSAGTVDFDGNVKVVASGSTAYGIEAEEGASINLGSTGKNVSVTATSTGGNAYGVYGKDGADIDLADTTITATSTGGRATGIYLENGSEMTVDGTLNITAEGGGVSGSVGAQGIRLAYSTATFNDDVTIAATATNEKAVAHGLNILADSGMQASNAIFEGNVKVVVDSAYRTYGAYVSGNASNGAEFKGEKLEIISKSSGMEAVGIMAAYGSKVAASSNTDTKIEVTAENGYTIGVWNAYNPDNNQVAKDIELLGNVEIIAKGESADSSYAVYHTANNAGECGDTTIGSIDKKVVIEGNIVVGGGNVTTTFGTADSKFDGKVETEGSGNATLNFNAGTWNLTGASTLTNATFGADSVLNIKGADFESTQSNYALNASEGNKSLTVEQGAKLVIEGIEEGAVYNIAKGFTTDKTVGENWTIDNNLLTGEWKIADTNGLQVTTVAKAADEIASDMGVAGGTADALAGIITAVNDASSTTTEAQQNVKDFANAIANAPAEQAADAAKAVVKMAEAGGNSATAASIVKNITGVTNDRLSFNCGHSAPHKGGHGVGLLEEGSGADIWVEYVHGKDEVEDMKSTAGATSYEGSYDGIVMGLDFKKVNKFQSGIAFNYGEGDTNSVGTSARTHSDYDFWGIGYYGNIHNEDSNVIFDINYAKTDSDVTNNSIGGLTYEASPETTTWTAGVKVEKLYQNENVQIVPYTGLRYMSIDSDDYATKCGAFNYKMERQDVWLLPLGVSIKQEVTNDNGWTVSPRVDLSYIWAFGDTDSDMEFATAYNNKVTNIGYDVMDDGSFLGLVGIEAQKGQWGFGVSYSYQKGDHSESKKWYVDVNYNF